MNDEYANDEYANAVEELTNMRMIKPAGNSYSIFFAKALMASRVFFGSSI